MQGEEACAPLAQHRPRGGIGWEVQCLLPALPVHWLCLRGGVKGAASRECVPTALRNSTETSVIHSSTQPRQMLYANAWVRVAWGRRGCGRGSLVAWCERAVLILMHGSSSIATTFFLAAGGSPFAGGTRELAEVSRVLSQLAFSRWLMCTANNSRDGMAGCTAETSPCIQSSAGPVISSPAHVRLRPFP